MSANFWKSSHFQNWIFDANVIHAKHREDFQILSKDEYTKLHVFYAKFIQKIGEQLKLKQQVIATATVYFKRFYLINSLKDVDPLLLAPTCLFLSSKVDEFGVISNSRLVAACQHVMKSRYGHIFTTSAEYPYRANHILEAEFYLLETLDCCLIVFHAYRPLLHLSVDLCSSEENKCILPTAWSIVNDSYRTDLSLMYPPHVIAIAAVHLACILEQKDCTPWFSELALPFTADGGTTDECSLLEVTTSLLSFYKLCESFDEKQEVPFILEKIGGIKNENAVNAVCSTTNNSNPMNSNNSNNSMDDVNKNTISKECLSNSTGNNPQLMQRH